MTIGLGAGAPGAAPRPPPPFALSSGLFGSGSAIVTSSFFESGDQSYPLRRPLNSVNCCASPPVRSRSQIWLPFALPGRLDVKERYRPSGLHRGALSDSALEVTRMCCVPSQLVIQISVSLLSAMVSTVLTVYATHL